MQIIPLSAARKGAVLSLSLAASGHRIMDFFFSCMSNCFLYGQLERRHCQECLLDLRHPGAKVFGQLATAAPLGYTTSLKILVMV